MLYFFYILFENPLQDLDKSGPNGGYQTLGFLFCEALSGLNCSCLQLLFVCGSFCLQLNKCMLDRVKNLVFDFAVAEYSTYFPSKTSGLLLQCFGSLSTCTVKRRPINFAGLSATGGHVCPCHHTASTLFYRWHYSICFGSRAVPSLLHTVPFSSFHSGTG